MIFGLDGHSWWVIKMMFAIIAGCLTIFGAVVGFLIVDRGEPDSKVWFNRVWTKIDQSPFFILPEICIGFLVNAKRGLILLPFRRIINNKILLCLFLTEFLIFIYLVWSSHVFEIDNPFFKTSQSILFAVFNWTRRILDSFWPSLSYKWKAGILYVIASLTKKGIETASKEDHSTGSEIFYLVLNIPFLLLVQLPFFLLCWYLFFAALYIVFFTANILLSILFIAIFSVLLLSTKAENNKRVTIIFLILTTINLTYLSFLLGDVFSVDINDYQPRTLQALIVNTFSDFLTVYLSFTILERLKNIKKKTIYLPMYVFICIIVSAFLCVSSLYFSLFKTDHAITITRCLYIFVGYASDLRHFSLGSLFWFMHSSFMPVLLYILVVFVAYFAKINLLPLRWFLGRAAINEQPLKLTVTFIGIFIAVFGLCTVIANELASRAKGIEEAQRSKKTSLIFQKKTIS